MEILTGRRSKYKKIFNVLRSILASSWIEKYNEFPKLLEGILPEGELKKQIQILLQRKKSEKNLIINLESRLLTIFR